MVNSPSSLPARDTPAQHGALSPCSSLHEAGKAAPPAARWGVSCRAHFPHTAGGTTDGPGSLGRGVGGGPNRRQPGHEPLMVLQPQAIAHFLGETCLPGFCTLPFFPLPEGCNVPTALTQIYLHLLRARHPSTSQLFSVPCNNQEQPGSKYLLHQGL